MIVLDYKDRRPLYEQVSERFQELIIKGILPRDMQMPSVRNQAMQLSINPNTIQRAYSELERQGYIYSVKGKGSFVADISSFLDKKKEAWRQEMNHVILEGYALGISRKEMETMVADGEGQHRKDTGYQEDTQINAPINAQINMQKNTQEKGQHEGGMMEDD